MKDDLRAELSREGLRFPAYPFPPSAAHDRTLIPWTAVRDGDPEAAPPEVRLATGETLFVTATQKTDLAAALAQVGIVVVRRPDAWHWLLEPYLDTSFTEAEEEATLARLEEAGVARAEAEAIRATVGRFVLAYNAVLWDWVHLGLNDLLVARRSPFTRIMRRVRGESFAKFYWWAMEIADRPTTAAGRPGPDAVP